MFSILLSAYLSADIVFAAESQGTKILAINSQKICGDSLCSVPMTIEQKIQMYLQRLQEKLSSDSQVFQQGTAFLAQPSSKLQVNPTAAVIGQTLPSGGPIILSAVEAEREIIVMTEERELVNNQSVDDAVDLGSDFTATAPAEQEPAPSEIIEIPPSEIGFKFTNDEGQDAFSAGLSGLGGNHDLSFVVDEKYFLPIVGFDYNTKKMSENVDCTSFSDIFTSKGPKTLTCTFRDTADEEVTESVSMTIVHQASEIGFKYTHDDGKDYFIPGLSGLGETPHNLSYDVTEDDFWPIVGWDNTTASMSTEVDCTDFSDVFSSEGERLLSCSFKDRANQEVTEEVTLTIVHQDPEIGFLNVDEGGNQIFEKEFKILSRDFMQNSPRGAEIPISIMAFDYIKNEYVENVNCNLPEDNIFPIGNTLLSCSYEDRGEKSDHKTATITVLEIQKPYFVMDFEDEYYPLSDEALKLQTSNPAGLEFEFSILGADNALGKYTTNGLSCDGIPRDFVFPSGTNNVNCEFTDSIGQRITSTLVLSVEYVESETVPEESTESAQTLWIFVPEDIAFPSDDPAGVALEFPAQAIDEYEGEVLAQCDPPSGSLFPVGENVVTCTAINSAGDVVQDFFVLTIEGPSGAVPSWIKQNALWWAEDQIDDTTFVGGIQYFVKEGIIVIPPTAEAVSDGSSEIPDWIKNNAEWWATDQIPDSAFIDGLQYLISNGIVRVN